MTTAHDTSVVRTRLLEVEQWLDDHCIAWRLENVPLADIDQRGGLANQTRIDALNADAVDRYTADMQAGAEFPPLILRRGDDHQWLPVDGNHRISSARNAGRDRHPAYVIETLTAVQAHELAIVANRTHGLPLTDEERLWHALKMIHEGSKVEPAAAAVGVAVDKLRRKLAVEKFTRRAVALQMHGWEDISESNRHYLQSIKDDEVFQRATRVVADRKVLAAEVQQLVARINTSQAADAIVELKEIEKRHWERRTPGRPPSAMTSPRRRLIGDLDILIARFTPAAVAADCETDMARQATSDQIKVAARHLMKIEKELWR